MTKKKRTRKEGREVKAWNGFPAWFTTPEGSWEEFDAGRSGPQLTRLEGRVACQQEKQHVWRHFYGSAFKKEWGEQLITVFVYCNRCGRFDVVWVNESERRT